ncbi:hypothetical protein ESCO_001546 [Escovopsis weberi]|uniref:Uncharacterized protein n=1 Tax=Escovopsis weberi TaxID=150374 RepID=A0A0M9VW78_ESCWE|nr:hypothetical protein ESCO_001546 [Escovopsis weberi]
MASPHSTSADERILELYPLAMMLLSIGLWTRLEDLGLDSSSPRPSERTLKLLSLRCGTLYTKAVQACWGAVEDALAGRDDSEVLLSSVQMRVSRFLEACCILDGVSGLEERLGTESSPPTEKFSSVQSPPELAEKLASFKESSSLDSKKPVAAVPSTAALPTIDQQSPDELEVSSRDTNEPKTKMRLYPHVPLPPDVVEKWNTILMPQINSALGSFYRRHPESVEISLESVGPSPHQTRPTVLVVCSSVSKVRSILNKRLGELFDDTTGFALRASTSGAEDAAEEFEAVNPEYQERPSNGASIGAWIGDRHLPPVSFGGLVIVDDKTYGMTVHHMLDDPDRDFALPETMRSSAVPGRLPFKDYSSTGNASEYEDEDEEEEYGYELSDDNISEPYSETDLTSDYESDEEDEEYNEPGDIPGIEPGCGEGYIITQPAMDDVEEGFYPCSETADEDHLDTFTLGELYASSGIRRRQVDGLVHEVDWALFEFAKGRQPDCNSIPRIASGARQRSRAQRHKGRKDQPQLRPTSVAPWSALPGMEVQCIARTSGLQAGRILPALTSVKIYGRTSPSHAYQVVGTASPPARGARSDSQPSVPLGIPGDSGAWIVDRERGQLCGHVLAWSQRKQVAYICPMDVLLQDIAQTLEATEVRLPGGQPLIALCRRSSAPRSVVQAEEEEEEEARESHADTDADAPALAQISSSLARSLSSPRLDVGDVSLITRNLGSVSIGSRRIDVNG